MFEAIALSFAIIFAHYACFLLALSQAKNWRRVGKTITPAASARFSGWISAGLSLLVCILIYGGSFATLLWPLLMGLSGLITALVLTYNPAWLLRALFWL
ncbi:MAG: DUF3325 family protein [Cyanobacteria bacterium P01_H01_bin.15]